MKTMLTVPIAAENSEQAVEQMRAAVKAGAEMLELRCDYLRNLTVDSASQLIKNCKTQAADLPIIVTCRDKAQGGIGDWPLQLRVDVLASAVDAGVDFIDFEYKNFTAANGERIKKAIEKRSKTRLILSAHDFAGKFDCLDDLYKNIKAAFGPVIPKIVYTANHINDCFAGFDLLHKTQGERIVICMGQAGQVSRILAKKLGSMVTFVTTSDSTSTALGQVSIAELKNTYHYDSIDQATELYGIIGSPVGHSLSPVVHNAGFAASGLNKLYLPLLVEGGPKEFDEFMANILKRDWLNAKGFSVTIPHKVNALNYTLSSSGAVENLAQRIGAVNTLTVDDSGKLQAFNTDYAGAMDAIISAKKVSADYFKGKKAAVIGAGGVARAIVAGLTDGGAEVTIYNRTVEKGDALAAEFGCRFEPADKISQLKSDILVNCTSIGMSPKVDESPVPAEVLRKGMVVFDTVYNPRRTLLLMQAEKAGAVIVDGLSMFIGQACRQFELFTGKKADNELMRKSICHCLPE